MSDPEVRVLKASYALKQKVGDGGFSAQAVKTATERLESAVDMFPTIAASDLAAIEQALKVIQTGDLSKPVLNKVYSACVELKSHGAMFKFPLVTMVADSLCVFLDAIKNVSMTIREVIALHLQTLKIAIAQGPRAITDKDKAELMSGLNKACVKAIEESKV